MLKALTYISCYPNVMEMVQMHRLENSLSLPFSWGVCWRETRELMLLMNCLDKPKKVQFKRVGSSCPHRKNQANEECLLYLDCGFD